MPCTGTSGHISLTDPSQSWGCAKDETSECAKDAALPSTSKSDGDYKKRAEREYYEKRPHKMLEAFYMDRSRRSMYRELQRDYETKISWARSLGIDPLAEDFDPTSPAPPELSSWLYLFYTYLQLEEAYAEALEWLNFKGRRLIDPPRPWRSFTEEAQECWSACTVCFTVERSKPGSRAAQHKRY